MMETNDDTAVVLLVAVGSVRFILCCCFSLFFIVSFIFGSLAQDPATALAFSSVVALA